MYTSVNSTSRTSRTKVVGLISLAVVGALVASYAVFSSIPAKAELIQISTSVDTAQLTQDYQIWKAKFGYTFDPQEDAVRFNIYAAADQLIKDHNSKNLSYKLGHNHFSHLSSAEHAAINLGLDPQRRNDSGYQNHSQRELTTTTVPTAVDWTTQGAVTPVKNQGGCGSCYSFSATGALEGLAFLKTGTLPSLSEQQIVDCSSSYGNFGCGGGWPTNVWKYVQAYGGLASETSYPYTSNNTLTAGTCEADGKDFAFKNTTITTTYTYTTANSTSALIAAIASQPVSVTIQADQFVFKHYSNGTISGTDCGYSIDHGVLAVGYNQTAGYFKIKNSWGASWGDSGYVLLATTNSNATGTCGILTYGGMYPS